MNRLVYALLGLFLSFSLAWAQDCTNPDSSFRFAANDGAGNGLSAGSPYTISQFWAQVDVVEPGIVNTLCLANGVYQGANNMIDPVNQVPQPDEGSAIKGTATYPVRIICVNDGQCAIDGESPLNNDTGRIPVNLRWNDYFIIEGIDAHDSNATVVQVIDSLNFIGRRIVAWNAQRALDGINNGNHLVFRISSGSHDSLCEDCAGWGWARKIFSSISSNGFICRRCFGKWMGYESFSPALTYSLYYTNTDGKLENGIMTWDEQELMTFPFTIQCENPSDDPVQCGTSRSNVDNPYGLISSDVDNPNPMIHDVYGSIAYLSNPSSIFNGSWSLVGFNNFRVGNVVRLTNVLSGIVTGYGGTRAPFALGAASSTGLGEATNITGFGPNDSFFRTQDWTVTNADVCQDHVSIDCATTFNQNLGQTLFQYDGSGGSLTEMCFEYVDGVKTATLMWPWRMQQRILDASTNAGFTPIDVMADITAMFGAPPPQCTRGAELTPTTTLQGGTWNNATIQ